MESVRQKNYEVVDNVAEDLGEMPRSWEALKELLLSRGAQEIPYGEAVFEGDVEDETDESQNIRIQDDTPMYDAKRWRDTLGDAREYYPANRFRVLCYPFSKDRMIMLRIIHKEGYDYVELGDKLYLFREFDRWFFSKGDVAYLNTQCDAKPASSSQTHEDRGLVPARRKNISRMVITFALGVLTAAAVISAVKSCDNEPCYHSGHSTEERR